MKTINIPSKFNLFGQTITVEYDQSLLQNGIVGQAQYKNNKILLQPSSEIQYRTRQQIEESFLHEVVHFLLYTADRGNCDPPLHSREYLVEIISGLIHQALSTMEGELK